LELEIVALGCLFDKGGDMLKKFSRAAILAFATAALVLGVAGAANAKHHPHGFSEGRNVGWHHHHVPPGWHHGQKVGWHSAGHPPGLR
jgi:hypothetical protein